MSISLFIMAAGKGSRFKLKDHKLCIPIAGKPAIGRFLERTRRLELESYVLLHESQAQEVKDIASASEMNILWQPTQDGTGGALQACIAQLKTQNKLPDYLLVMNADMPCIQTSTLRTLLQNFQDKEKKMQMVATTFPFETGFGRVLQKEFSIDITEQKDCTVEDLEQGLVNTGIYWLPVAPLLKVIDELPPHLPSNEKYITDLFRYKWIKKSGCKAHLIYQKNWEDFLGLNTALDLKRAEEIIQEQIHEILTDQGVHIKGRGYVEETVEVGQDTVIYPGVTLTGNTKIGEQVVLEANCTLHQATIGNHTRILSGSYIENSHVGEHCTIGPHAHIRQDTHIASHCRIGNFVEMKNTQLGEHSKAAHLAYVGDTEAGKNVNISCGVITCNYDGVTKHKTVIEDDVFVGSDVQLIAPIRIGKGSYIASGSTINQDMAAGDFAVARARQVTKKGAASRFRPKK